MPDREDNEAYRERVDALQRTLREDGADAAAVYPGPNSRYLVGVFGEPLDRHFVLVVPATGDPWVVTPPKCLDLLREEARVSETRVVDANDPAAVAKGVADSLSRSPGRLLIDDRAPFSVSAPLREATGAELGPLGPVVEPLRIAKDDGEIAALRRSAAVADEVSEEIRAFGADAVGMTESGLANEIRGRLHAKGATRLSFDVVVASGPNAADPYRRNGEREIREGDVVIVDFGGFVDGYASDQTRTVVFGGDPPERFEAASEAVRDALDAGVDAVEPGIPAGAVDRAANEAIADHGFEGDLVHATGHGVGLEAHEAPTIAEGNDRTLEPGMVFSVEPGVYLDGEFGVRVEDLVVVTEDGCERLNDSPRTWKPL